MSAGLATRRESIQPAQSCSIQLSHRIGGNCERKIFNNFMIAKNNVFDYQNRYYGNRKCLICVQQSSLWQSKTLYLAIVNDLPVNKRSFMIAAYPVWS